MARRVETEYVDDVVVDDRRPAFFNPVGAIVSLTLLGLLIWALFWGPIGEMFDGDGNGPSVDTPNINNTNK
ncbi:MAG TPA: hypothetical protein VM030_03150 [Acidimicrobiales bacterium]|nr:hypothetical protein [Acidimicrobiales bacterium]